MLEFRSERGFKGLLRLPRSASRNVPRPASPTSSQYPYRPFPKGTDSTLRDAPRPFVAPIGRFRPRTRAMHDDTDDATARLTMTLDPDMTSAYVRRRRIGKFSLRDRDCPHPKRTLRGAWRATPESSHTPARHRTAPETCVETPEEVDRIIELVDAPAPPQAPMRRARGTRFARRHFSAIPASFSSNSENVRSYSSGFGFHRDRPRADVSIQHHLLPIPPPILHNPMDPIAHTFERRKSPPLLPASSRRFHSLNVRLQNEPVNIPLDLEPQPPLRSSLSAPSPYLSLSAQDRIHNDGADDFWFAERRRIRPRMFRAFSFRRSSRNAPEPIPLVTSDIPWQRPGAPSTSSSMGSAALSDLSEEQSGIFVSFRRFHRRGKGSTHSSSTPAPRNTKQPSHNTASDDSRGIRRLRFPFSGRQTPVRDPVIEEMPSENMYGFELPVDGTVWDKIVSIERRLADEKSDMTYVGEFATSQE